MVMTLRQAVRNYLYPMTLAEMRVELDLSIKRGDTTRADYVHEYICEAQSELEQENSCIAWSYREDEKNYCDCSDCNGPQ